MAGYFIANYTITNPDGYQEYLAAVGPTLTAHGAERIVVDRGSDLLEGSAGQVTVRAEVRHEGCRHGLVRVAGVPGHQAHAHGQHRRHRGHRGRQLARSPVRAARHQLHGRHEPGRPLPGRMPKAAAVNSSRHRPWRQDAYARSSRRSRAPIICAGQGAFPGG